MPRIIGTAFVLLAGTTACLSVVAPLLHAASALELVVGECQKRTGFGESTCTTLIKKYMNVERCKEYTGYSDAECVQKIEEIKNDFGSVSTGTNVPAPPRKDETARPVSEALPPIDAQGSVTLGSLREKKERDLVALWKRTELLTQSLKDRGVDTQSIEAHFPEFEKRAEALLAAYDTYRSVHERTSGDSPTTRSTIRRDARQKVIQAKDQVLDYYRTSILIPLRTAENPSP
ncbi:MAG: hypothetical protein WAT84_03270 [Candidatus Moraniibacteriota bacterium]